MDANNKRTADEHRFYADKFTEDHTEAEPQPNNRKSHSQDTALSAVRICVHLRLVCCFASIRGHLCGFASLGEISLMPIYATVFAALQQGVTHQNIADHEFQDILKQHGPPGAFEEIRRRL